MKPLNKDYYIDIHSPAHCIAVQNRLFELGFLWASGGNTIQYENSAYIFLYQEDKSFTRVGYKEYNVAGKHPVTLDGLYAPPFTGPSPITVPLNDAYSAEVSKEGISVSVNGVKQTDISYPLSVLDLLVEAKGRLTEGAENVTGKAIIVKSKEHSEAIQRRCFEIGFKWTGHDDTVKLTEREVLWPQKYLSHSTLKYAKEHAEFITLDDLYGPKFTGVSEVEVDLGDVSYPDALVTKDSVKIGCQSFPISVLDALLAARKEVTE